jgi:hypothetical protein
LVEQKAPCILRVQASSLTRWSKRRATVRRRILILNIPEQSFQWRTTTNGNHGIGTVPKTGFPEVWPQVRGEFLPDTPGGHSFQIGNQPGEVKCRMSFNQEVDMISFTAKLNQAATPLAQHVVEDGFQPLEHLRRDAPMAILNCKDNMVIKSIS